MVLYGGTAVALYCGHRQSVDFDFFGPAPLDKDGLRKALSVVSTGIVVQDDVNTLSVLSQEVKLSFFGISTKALMPAEVTEDQVLVVASRLDLLSHKLKVILQRAEAKDYKDIAVLLDSGVTLKDGLFGAQSIFGQDFPIAEAVKALTYFEDGDLRGLDVSIKAKLKAEAIAILNG